MSASVLGYREPGRSITAVTASADEPVSTIDTYGLLQRTLQLLARHDSCASRSCH